MTEQPPSKGLSTGAIVGIAAAFLVTIIIGFAYVGSKIEQGENTDPYAKCEQFFGGTDSKCSAEVAMERLNRRPY